MLRQEELVFIEAISMLELSPAFLKEYTKALKSRRKKKPVVTTGNRRTMP